MNSFERDSNLDQFGYTLMSEVRDKTILELENIMQGTMKGASAEYFNSLLAHLNDSEIDTVARFSKEMIDRTIHNFLWMFEQSFKFRLVATRPEGAPVDLAENSDGLTGELYSDQGWISRYSAKGPSRTDAIASERLGDS